MFMMSDIHSQGKFSRRAKVAGLTFVADADERAGAHVGVTDHALAVALLAQAANGDARLLAAHDQVGVVLGHDAPSSCDHDGTTAPVC
jgi:hypothetical protein